MTLLYQSAQFLDHDTGRHPECADRLRAVTRHLADSGLGGQCRRPPWQPVSGLRMGRVRPTMSRCRPPGPFVTRWPEWQPARMRRRFAW